MPPQTTITARDSIHAPIFTGAMSINPATHTTPHKTSSATQTHLATHSYHVLSLCLEGAGTMRVGSQTFALSQNVLVLLPAGMPHSTTASSPLRVLGVGFCVSCLQGENWSEVLLPFERARAGGAAATQLDAAASTELQRRAAVLSEELSHSNNRSTPSAQAALLLILSHVRRAWASNPQPTTLTSHTSAPDLVRDALRYIEQHCLQPISLQDVATATRRSTSYLTERVRQSTGKTVQRWIIEARMTEARRLLDHSDERVDVIAERVGYADATHFIRLYKRHFNMTPAAWRAAHRG